MWSNNATRILVSYIMENELEFWQNTAESIIRESDLSYELELFYKTNNPIQDKKSIYFLLIADALENINFKEVALAILETRS